MRVICLQEGISGYVCLHHHLAQLARAIHHAPLAHKWPHTTTPAGTRREDSSITVFRIFF